MIIGFILLQTCFCLPASQDKHPQPENKIQLIRNATMKITYAGKTFLTDPMLSPKGAFGSFAGIASNPTVELPLSNDEILTGAEFIVVSHLHPDHFDAAAERVIPKNLPVFCQPGDEELITKKGFEKVLPIATTQMVDGITITLIGGKHGKGEILKHMGKVSGFVFQAPGEPTIYWAGDSILCEEVENAIRSLKPDIIITHSGGACKPGFDPIIMNDMETLAVAELMPNSKIVAVHMESLDHCTISRVMLREMAEKKGISSSRLIIPVNGTIIKF